MDDDRIDYGDPAFQQVASDNQHRLDLQFHSAQFRALEDITSLVEAIRRAEVLGDYRRIQRHLGERLALVEKGVGQANEQLSRVDRRLRRLRRRLTPPDPQELATVARERSSADFDRELYLRLARQYRCVGDAMAWQLYGFQTRYVNALGMNDSPGLINQKVGSAAEEQEVERFWHDEGAFALRHDFTNCLRVWDLSAFYPDHPEQTAIVEVKAGEKSRVRSRQRLQAVRVAEFIKRRVATSQDGALLIHRSQESYVDDPIAQTNLPLIASAIMQANEEGYGFAANRYLAIRAVSLLHDAIRNPDEDMKRKLLHIRDIPDELLAIPCADYLFGFSDDKLKSAYGAPYSIYPLPPDFVAALVTGYLRLVFCLNTCAVIEACRNAGVEAAYIRPGDGGRPTNDRSGQSYFTLRRGNAMMRIGAVAVEQILFEGLPIEDLVASIARELQIMNARHPIVVPKLVGDVRRPVRALTTFIGLENVWRASRNALLYRSDL